jgi:hypothetical protein
MNELIFIVENAPEGRYTARALDDSIMAEADTIAELHEQVRNAVRSRFEHGESRRIIRIRFVRERTAAAA